jgi:adenosylmethionine-8-amino-7-oxononanoate aminotransferase
MSLSAGGSGVRDTALWHPFAQMARVRSAEFVITRGEGVWVWGDDGRRYLDGTASLWYANVGHGRKEIADAVAEQIGALEAYSIFGDIGNPPALRLAERLSALAPMDDARVFFGSGGGDGIETASKLARFYWQAIGSSERIVLISRGLSYHGTHGYGTSLAGIEANRSGWGPTVSAISVVPHDSVDALRDEIDRVGAERVAAFFVEPVIGAGGVYPPVEGYLEGVAAVCRDTGVLLVVDEVICGFGRLGTWFGIERWDVMPDLVVFAKGVTSGYLPLGGVIVGARVAEPFWTDPTTPVFRHGMTYSGHPACCAAALANLEILEREQLVGRGSELERALYDALAPLERHPLVAEVRGGTGLLAAVELTADVLRERPTALHELYVATREAGALVRPLLTSVAVSPPLTIAPEEIQFLAKALAQGLEMLSAAVDRPPEPAKATEAPASSL